MGVSVAQEALPTPASIMTWGTSHPWDKAIGSIPYLPHPKVNDQFGFFLEQGVSPWSAWAP